MGNRERHPRFQQLFNLPLSGTVSRREVLRRASMVGAGASTLAILGQRADAIASPATAETTEITVWLNGEPGTVNAITELIDEYQSQHPEVTSKVTFVGSSLFNPTLLPALNAGSGPDIWMGGTGPGQAAAIIAAGHALDLTSYFCQYGWNKVIPETIVNYTSSDGKLWAVGDSVETTVMFYNKDIFAKNKVTVPTTWDEFVAVCEALKGAGHETVIGLGGSDKWPISHWQSMLWGRYAGPEGVDKVMFGEGRWDEDPFIQATTKLQDLNKAGYFGPEPLAVVYDDMIAQFWRGEIPMTFTGPWIIGDAVRDLGDAIKKFSVFEVPSPVPGAPLYPTEDIGTGWYINAKAKAPDIAADLLNFMFFRAESRNKLLGSGDDVPVGPLDLEKVELPALLEEALGALNQNRDNGTIHAFLDTVTPSNMTDVTYDGLQALLADQMSPEEFTAAVQAAWEEAKDKNEQLKPGGVSC